MEPLEIDHRQRTSRDPEHGWKAWSKHRQYTTQSLIFSNTYEFETLSTYCKSVLMMEWAVDTTYHITDMSSVVKSVRSLKLRSCHILRIWLVRAESMPVLHPGSIEACVAAACLLGIPKRILLSLNLAMAPLQEARQWLCMWDSSSMGGMTHALKLAMRLSLNRLKFLPMLCFLFSQLSIERPLWYSVILPCVLHGRSIETVLSWGKPRCHWFDNVWVQWYGESFPVIMYWLFSSNISGGTDRASVYDVCTVSTDHDSQQYSIQRWAQQLL